MEISLKGNSAVLINAVSVLVTKQNANTLEVPAGIPSVNFQASGKVDTGAATAIVVFEVANRGDWVEAGRIELALTAAGDGDGFASQRWNSCRAFIESITGTYTGLSITATVGVGG